MINTDSAGQLVLLVGSTEQVNSVGGAHMLSASAGHKC